MTTAYGVMIRIDGPGRRFLDTVVGVECFGPFDTEEAAKAFAADAEKAHMDRIMCGRCEPTTPDVDVIIVRMIYPHRLFALERITRASDKVPHGTHSECLPA